MYAQFLFTAHVHLHFSLARLSFLGTAHALDIKEGEREGEREIPEKGEENKIHFSSHERAARGFNILHKHFMRGGCSCIRLAICLTHLT